MEELEVIRDYQLKQSTQILVGGALQLYQRIRNFDLFQFFLRFYLAAHSQILSALPSTGRFKGGHVSYAPYIDFIPNVTIICVM